MGLDYNFGRNVIRVDGYVSTMVSTMSALCQHYASTAIPFLPFILPSEPRNSVSGNNNTRLSSNHNSLSIQPHRCGRKHSGHTRSHGGCARPYLYGECRGKSRGISSTACGSVIGKVVSRCGSCVAARNAGLSCKCGMSTLTPDDASIEPAPEPAPAMIKLSLPPSACDSADSTNANNANNNVRVTP